VFFTSEKQVTCRADIVPFFAVHGRRGGLNPIDPAQKIDRGTNNRAASGCRTESGGRYQIAAGGIDPRSIAPAKLRRGNEAAHGVGQCAGPDQDLRPYFRSL
jgi:hypothetical protein